VVVVVVASPGSSTTSRATLPRFGSALSTTGIFATAVAVFDSTARLAATTATHLGHECVELVLCRSAADTRLRAIAAGTTIVAPGLTDLAIGTVTSHVPSLTADAADDAGSEVLLLRAIILAMADLAAVLAGLILIVAKSTVEGGKLAELIALELVLAFGDGGSL
jgi:hypothetical protein